MSQQSTGGWFWQVGIGVACVWFALWWVGKVPSPRDEFDRFGLIVHHQQSTISAESDWLVGESKNCFSEPSKYGGSAVERIGCQWDKGPQHQMEITFHGRLKQPEYIIVAWKCVREKDGFTCYDLSGLPGGTGGENEVNWMKRYFPESR